MGFGKYVLQLRLFSQYETCCSVLESGWGVPAHPLRTHTLRRTRLPPSSSRHPCTATRTPRSRRNWQQNMPTSRHRQRFEVYSNFRAWLWETQLRRHCRRRAWLTRRNTRLWPRRVTPAAPFFPPSLPPRTSRICQPGLGTSETETFAKANPGIARAFAIMTTPTMYSTAATMKMEEISKRE